MPPKESIKQRHPDRGSSVNLRRKAALRQAVKWGKWWLGGELIWVEEEKKKSPSQNIMTVHALVEKTGGVTTEERHRFGVQRGETS